MTQPVTFTYTAPYRLTRATPDASGFDLRATETVTARAGQCVNVGTGVRVALRNGHEAQVRGRSGLAFKHHVLAFVGTIDEDYRGEIRVLLFNASSSDYPIIAGDRIAQLVISQRVNVELALLDEHTFAECENNTARGEAGFGSTGNR